MSTKAMGRMYTGLAHPSSPPIFGGASGGQSPMGGLLAAIFGQNKMTGGPQIDPTTGQLQFSPYQGPSGIFGGATRGAATQLNQPYFQAMLAAQNAKMLQQLIGEQTLSQIGKRGEEERATESSKEVNALAAKLGVTPDQITGALKNQLGLNAEQEAVLTGQAMKMPGYAQNLQAGLNAQASAPATAADVSRRLEAPQGGIATMPNSITGGNTTVQGATPTTTFQMVGTGPVNPQTGMPMMQTPVTTQRYTPGSASFPVNRNMYNQAVNMPPPANQAPGFGGVVSPVSPVTNPTTAPQGAAMDPNALRNVSPFNGMIPGSGVSPGMKSDIDQIMQLYQMLQLGGMQGQQQ